MIAGLLLAAGGATRFGSQKLITPLAGDIPLVRHTAATLRDAVDALYVVVGHDADAVRFALIGVDATIVMNDDWSDGLSTSLRAGVRAVPDNTVAVLVGLGDQPFVDPAVMRAVITEWRTTGAPIVSARYDGTRGHPVLFDRSIFAELEEATGDAGARGLIERAPDRVAYVDVTAPPPLDVDTTDDLARLRGRSRPESTQRNR